MSPLNHRDGKEHSSRMATFYLTRPVTPQRPAILYIPGLNYQTLITVPLYAPKPCVYPLGHSQGPEACEVALDAVGYRATESEVTPSIITPLCQRHRSPIRHEPVRRKSSVNSSIRTSKFYEASSVPSVHKIIYRASHRPTGLTRVTRTRPLNTEAR